MFDTKLKQVQLEQTNCHNVYEPVCLFKKITKRYSTKDLENAQLPDTNLVKQLVHPFLDVALLKIGSSEK